MAREERMDGGLSIPTVASAPGHAFGQYVRDRRQALDLSQSELAARCGVSQKTISLIESGQTQQPRLNLLDRLAAAFGESRADLERRVLQSEASVSRTSVTQASACPHCGAMTEPIGQVPPPGLPVLGGGNGVQQARRLVDALVLQAVNHPSDDVVQLVRQTAGFLAAEYGSRDRADRAAMELAIDSFWIVGRTYANVVKRRVNEGDVYFDHAAALASQIRDWDRWAQAIWRKANHHRKLDDLIVARDRATLHQARADYDLALIWLENVLDSGASAAWRSVAHSECAKIAISTQRESLFLQHIGEARRLATLASTSAAPPTWPPFLSEYAEVLWRDRYLLGMAMYDAGTESEMHRLIEETRQFRHGLTAPFDRVMLPLSQTLRDLKSGDRQTRERGAVRGWRIMRRAQAMGLDNFARLALRALRDAGLLESGRQLYESELQARQRG
jgi:DNA-binding XRE family transcriptional regulator